MTLLVQTTVGNGSQSLCGPVLCANQLFLVRGEDSVDVSLGQHTTAGMCPIAQLKCIYTDVHNMGNKGEQKAIAWWEIYALIVLTETWWDPS